MASRQRARAQTRPIRARRFQWWPRTGRRWRSSRSSRSRAPAQDDRFHRREQDDHVERDRHVLDVEQIVLELLEGILDAGAVGVLNLRPAGQSGPNDMTLTVER